MQLADKVKKLAGKTHKDRVNELNTKLETLSEHHDIPKVNPIGNLLVSRLINASIRSVLDKTVMEHPGVPPHSRMRIGLEWMGLGGIIVACLCNDLK